MTPHGVIWFTRLDAADLGVIEVARVIYTRVKEKLPNISLMPVRVISVESGDCLNDVDVNLGSARVAAYKWTGYELIVRR